MSRVLVARLDSVGDVLLAGPAVRAVANGRRPDGGAPNDVVMLCGPQGEAAASLLPGVAEVFSWGCPWIVNPAPASTGPRRPALTTFVRDSRIAEAVILTSFHQSPLPLALLLRLAGVERITGASTDYAGSPAGRPAAAGRGLPGGPAGGGACPGHRPGGRLPAARGRRRQAAGPATFPTCAPGGRGALRGGPPRGRRAASRAWPPLHHAAAVELLEGAGHRVVVTGGPGETGSDRHSGGPLGPGPGRPDGPADPGRGACRGRRRGHRKHRTGAPRRRRRNTRWPACSPRWCPRCAGRRTASRWSCSATRTRPAGSAGRASARSPGTRACQFGGSPDDVVEAVERLIGGVSSLSTRAERFARHENPAVARPRLLD